MKNIEYYIYNDSPVIFTLKSFEVYCLDQAEYDRLLETGMIESDFDQDVHLPEFTVLTDNEYKVLKGVENYGYTPENGMEIWETAEEVKDTYNLSGVEFVKATGRLLELGIVERFCMYVNGTAMSFICLPE